MAPENIRKNCEGTALIIFVRLPSPGKVKSRLAKSLGDKTAAAFYRKCAERLFNECSMVGGDVKSYVYYSDSSDREAVKCWAGPGFRFLPQYNGGLGERIEHALAEVFGLGAKQAIIMASDVPDLSAKLVNDAINRLADYNIVIGPSLDGGYYLLGVKRLYHDLFRDIWWSTDKVLHQTVDAAKKLGLAIKLMPVLRDIDTIRDLREWMETADTENPVLKYVRANLVMKFKNWE